jgi:hypothetical protein
MENLFGISIGGDGINKKFRKETFFASSEKKKVAKMEKGEPETGGGGGISERKGAGVDC